MSPMNPIAGRQLMQRLRDEHSFVCNQITGAMNNVFLLDANIGIAMATNDDQVIELLREQRDLNLYLNERQQDRLKLESNIIHLAALTDALEACEGTEESQEIIQQISRLMAAA